MPARNTGAHILGVRYEHRESPEPEGRRYIWRIPELLPATGVNTAAVIAIMGTDRLICGNKSYTLESPDVIQALNTMRALAAQNEGPAEYTDLRKFWDNPRNGMRVIAPSVWRRSLFGLDKLAADAAGHIDTPFALRTDTGTGNHTKYRLNPGLVFKDGRSWPELKELMD